MKRFVTAFIIALAIHGLAFSLGGSWMNVFPPPPGPPKPVTISLAVRTHLQADKNRVDRKTGTAPADKPEKISAPPSKLHSNAKTIKPVIQPTPQKISLPRKPKKSLKRLTRTKPTATLSRPKPEIRPQQAPGPVRPVESATASAILQKNKPQPSPVSGNTVPAADISRPDDTPATPGKKGPLATTAVKMARPLYVKNSVPRYPRRARKKGLQGTVMLEVLVDETGQVKNLRLLRSSGHAILDKAAIASVKKWVFVPGAINGAPAGMWVKVPIRFELN